jgi:serine/threonine protein kinase
VQRAVQHLLANDLIHGDIKDDQFFLTAEGSVVLGDFGTAWKLIDDDGVAQQLGGRDELLTRRCEHGWSGSRSSPCAFRLR